MIDDNKMVFIPCHWYYDRALMNHLLLDTGLRKDSQVALIGVASAPASTRGNSFYGLSIIHFIVPFLLLFPLIKRLKVNVWCLFINFIWVGIDFSIFFVVILVLHHPLGCKEQPWVIKSGHGASKVIVKWQVSVEILVAEVNIDWGELGLAAQDNGTTKVPGKNAVVSVDWESLVFAVRVESFLRHYVDKLVHLVSCNLVNHCRGLWLDSHYSIFSHRFL